MEILLTSLICVFAAYFIKGFSGFGPALLIIPTFTLLYDPYLALSYSGIFDFIAGISLIGTVYKSINWKIVLPITFFLLLGAYLGIFFFS